MTTPKPPTSPTWSASSKRLVILILFLLGALAVYRIRTLLLPVGMAAILAYLIEPIARWLVTHIRLPRTLTIGIIYLLIVAALVSIPVSTITPIINQANNLILNTPRYVQQVGELFQEPIVVLDSIEIPIDQLSLDQAFTSLSSNLIGIVQTLGGQTLTIFGGIATATLSTVGWIILVLFLSFYMVKDHQKLLDAIINTTPTDYHHDVRQLINAINITWHAFLRGQLVLCVVVGVIFFIIALIIGLPNALILAIIAGLMELIPTFGPILAAIPAVLVAFFQANSSWVGSIMSPFWFGMLVLAIYGLIYQFENYYLVPRIIGHHLKLHPLVIIIGVLAGASVAGVLGILFAAPVLATARLILHYIYCKLTDREPFAGTVVDPLLDTADDEEAVKETAVSPSENDSHSIGPVSGD